MSITKNGIPLIDLEVWGRLAGPKSVDQWVPDRSAMETARAWLAVSSPQLPEEVDAALRSHPSFGPCIAWRGEPEVQLRFDAFPGEPRNTDLLLVCNDAHGDYLLAVEAKADESFADLASDALADAVEAKIANPRSNALVRIEQLATAILGARVANTPRLRDIRYQLLTATAGVLAEANRRGLSRALLLVHEFVTDKTRDENHQRNAADLGHFVARLSSGRINALAPGSIVGPFAVPGAPLFNKSPLLFVGKVSRNIRSAGS